MTETEKKALALVNEVSGTAYPAMVSFRQHEVAAALCRAIERIEALEATERDCRDCDYAKPLMELQVEFEAFRREVSDEIEGCLTYVQGYFVKGRLGRFILPKPVDPLVEAVNKAWGWRNPHPDVTNNLRAALDALGFEIREKQP